jgi:uncharacterized membrane protein
MSKSIKKPNEKAEILKEQDRALVKKEVIQEVRQQLFSGPIPSPEALERYEQICPGAADRIISMAEKEQNERIAADKTHQKDNTDIATKELIALTRGQYFGFISVLAVLSLCFFIGYQGELKTASTLAGGITVALASAFVYKSRADKGKQKQISKKPNTED